MSKKKSLGHNPLAYSTRNHASFDFIAPSMEHEAKKEPADSAPEPEKKVNKITTSYYLEEPMVEKIKALADANDMSYSAFVTDLLKKALNSHLE